ncbi:uncharacterized protein PAC_14651 [Phialocephala subalpina]|uniref:Uncharacterized protein n=1 Tax=Phialocephala subalpina TaxID=576137 RepID=A0A1L7XI92_9HELO|nr:uncharacterized protein PAC_14651 [Phialocephala subalpina]
MSSYTALSFSNLSSNVWYSLQQNTTGMYFGCGAGSDLNGNFSLHTSANTGDTLWQFAGADLNGVAFLLRPNTCGGKDIGQSYCLNAPVHSFCDTNCTTLYPILQQCNNNSLIWDVGLSMLDGYVPQNSLIAWDPNTSEFYLLGLIPDNNTISLDPWTDQGNHMVQDEWELASVSEINDKKWSTFPADVNSAIAGSTIPTIVTTTTSSTSSTSRSSSSSSSSSPTTTYGLQTSTNFAITATQTFATSQTSSVSPTSPSKTSAAAARSELRSKKLCMLVYDVGTEGKDCGGVHKDVLKTERKK